jgi:hypothetical protein
VQGSFSTLALIIWHQIRGSIVAVPELTCVGDNATRAGPSDKRMPCGSLGLGIDRPCWLHVHSKAFLFECHSYAQT